MRFCLDFPRCSNYCACVSFPTSYEIEPTRELVALGFTNIGGSVLFTLPALGSLSRSALNASGGTKTQLAGLVRCRFQS